MNYLSILIIVVLASGCKSNDMSELHGYVDDVLARPGGHIEQAPYIKPYEAYTYKSAKENQRDPFTPFYIDVNKNKEKQPKTGLTADQVIEVYYRNQEELEEFELDSLRMVGTLTDAIQTWGLVLDPGGAIHKVRSGNYLGRSIGKVTNIHEDSIELREIVQNNQGSWEERKASIALIEG